MPGGVSFDQDRPLAKLIGGVEAVADQKRWFKLWCSAVRDSDFDNLSIADFGRWCKLGALTTEQGTAGVLTISAPARAFCAMLQVADFSAAVTVVKTLPNVVVQMCEKRNDAFTVTFLNWRKYQEDQTNRERQKRFRAKQRNDLRGEEKRGEENIPPIVPQKGDADDYSQDFENFFWEPYPKKTGKGAAWKAWKKLRPSNGLRERIKDSVIKHTLSQDWKKENGQFIPNPATFLNQKRFDDAINAARNDEKGGVARVWSEIVLHVRQRGSQAPISGIPEDARTALFKIGGLAAIGNADSYRLQVLETSFRNAYEKRPEGA